VALDDETSSATTAGLVTSTDATRATDPTMKNTQPEMAGGGMGLEDRVVVAAQSPNRRGDRGSGDTTSWSEQPRHE